MPHLYQLQEKHLQCLFSLWALYKCSTLPRALTGSIQTAWVGVGVLSPSPVGESLDTLGAMLSAC